MASVGAFILGMICGGVVGVVIMAIIVSGRDDT